MPTGGEFDVEEDRFIVNSLLARIMYRFDECYIIKVENDRLFCKETVLLMIRNGKPSFAVHIGILPYSESEELKKLLRIVV